MNNLKYVGLDVHQDTITIAVAPEGNEAPQCLDTIAAEVPKLLQRLRKLGPLASLRCCYEAGPGGFTLQRSLAKEGISCIVIAPSLVPKQPGQKVKTDRRDAVKLARFLRSGDLTAVNVPSEQTEAMRDLSRARIDARQDATRCRQRLARFLGRHGRRFKGKTNTKAFLVWANAQTFEQEAHLRVRKEYVRALEDAMERVARIMSDIEELTPKWELAPVVKALQAFRGIKLITAVGITSEIADFHRFSNPRQLMAYIGSVPGERSSGATKLRTRITRSGNAVVRTLLVESAWAYRSTGVSAALQKRREGVPDEVVRIARKAETRLHRRMHRLWGRGLMKQKVVIAIARELAGFIWAAARAA